MIREGSCKCMMADLIAAELDQVHERIVGRFARAEPRARVREYVSGLAAGLERKNGWTLAEQAGESVPDGMQRLLRRADWDVDGVRDDVRGYAIGHLGDPGGVFLAYASAHGHALVDRELYLPRSWAEDRDRCREAGIPDETQFATKPQLAQAMISRAIEAGVPFAWFTADEAYGQAKWLQAWLEERGVSYVMAIRRSGTLTMAEGERRADDLVAAAPARSWQKISAGAGRTARASTTGRGSRCGRAGNAAAAAGCWPAAPSPARRRSPTPPAPAPAAPAPPTWPGPREAAGT